GAEAAAEADPGPWGGAGIGAVIAFAEDEEERPADTAMVWRVIGRGFSPIARQEPAAAEPVATDEPPVGVPPAEEPAEPEIAQAAAAITDGVTPDPDTVDRVSRYNFDELSRILTDRVGSEAVPAAEAAAPNAPARGAGNESSLIS